MKLFKRMAVLSLCVLALAGCTKSSVTSADIIMTEEAEGVEKVEADDNIVVDRTMRVEKINDPLEFDWEQVAEEAKDMFMDEDYYPLTLEMGFNYNIETPTIYLMWNLSNEATEDDAMEYTTEMVQHFNNIMATQKTDYEFATYNTFGTVWNTFALNLKIEKADGTVMIEKNYAAGEEIDLKLPEYSGEGPQASTEVSAGPADAKKE